MSFHHNMLSPRTRSQYTHDVFSMASSPCKLTKCLHADEYHHKLCHADRLYGRTSSDDVVQSVRRLRAERDQLRLRDRDHSRHMHQVNTVLCSSVLQCACCAVLGCAML